MNIVAVIWYTIVTNAELFHTYDIYTEEVHDTAINSR